MKKIMTKIFCFVFAIVSILGVLPLTAYAAVAVDSSYVLSDLKKTIDPMTGKTFDISNYPYIENADFCSLIVMHEYGYDFWKRQNDYGLYIYVYNPSGRAIEDSRFNKIQLSSNEGGKYSKYGLRLISSSTEKGYERVFYKFKIAVNDDFYRSLSISGRTYCISGMEFKYVDSATVVEYDVSCTYTYYGFDSYHGEDTTDKESTLRCEIKNLETIRLELHDASWKTASSDKGVNHQYEISTVYFAIPNYYLKKYGSDRDVYNGLYGITCEWEEYKINGLVTNNTTLYGEAMAWKGVNVGRGRDSIPFAFRLFNASEGERALFNNYGWKYVDMGNYSDPSHPYYYKASDYGDISMLSNVIYYSDDNFKIITSSELKDIILDENGRFTELGFVDDGRVLGYQKQEFTVEDGSLNSQISSYALGKKWYEAIGAFLQGNYSQLWADKDGYSEMSVFYKLSEDDFEESDPVAFEKLFVCEEDYKDLKSFYTEAAKNDCSVFLLRFAVTDYIFAEAAVVESNKILFGTAKYSGGRHYYFEKTIFDKFDYINMSFENNNGFKTILPVVSSPITITGSITNTPGTGGDGGNDKPHGCNGTTMFEAISLLLGVTAIVFIAFGLFKLISFISSAFERKRNKVSGTTINIKGKSQNSISVRQSSDVIKNK